MRSGTEGKNELKFASGEYRVLESEGAVELTVVRVAAQDVARAREVVESYEQSQREPATPAMTGSPLPSPLLVVALFLVSVLVLVNWFG